MSDFLLKAILSLLGFFMAFTAGFNILQCMCIGFICLLIAENRLDRI